MKSIITELYTRGSIFVHLYLMCLQAMQRRLKGLESDRSGLEVKLEERQAEMATLLRELSDLKAKKDRLSKQVTYGTYMYIYNVELRG